MEVSVTLFPPTGGGNAFSSTRILKPNYPVLLYSVSKLYTQHYFIKENIVIKTVIIYRVGRRKREYCIFSRIFRKLRKIFTQFLHTSTRINMNMAIYSRFSSNCISYNGVICRILNNKLTENLYTTCNAQ